MEKGNYPVNRDFDSLINRKNELTLQDKPPHDEKVANIITDYHNKGMSVHRSGKDYTNHYWKTDLILPN